MTKDQLSCNRKQIEKKKKSQSDSVTAVTIKY